MYRPPYYLVWVLEKQFMINLIYCTVYCFAVVCVLRLYRHKIHIFSSTDRDNISIVKSWKILIHHRATDKWAEINHCTSDDASKNNKLISLKKCSRLWESLYHNNHWLTECIWNTMECPFVHLNGESQI